MSARAFRLRGQAPREAESFVAAVPAVTDQAIDPALLLDSELIAYRWRIRDLAASGMRAEVTVVLLGAGGRPRRIAHALKVMLDPFVRADD